MHLKKNAFFIFVLFFLPHLLTAQVPARVLTGIVSDGKTDEPLIGATVVVLGTKKGSKTNINGEYKVNLIPGKYILKVSFMGYLTISKNVVISETGAIPRQDIKLFSDDIEVEEIVVQSKMRTSSENAALVAQKTSLSVSDGLSSESFKKTGDSDAGESIKRVTGISVKDGKYILVRGLGDRYSSTQMNGLSIPSPEPEKKAVPFDLIPSNLLDNITTTKTFLPDQPGSFAGGVVNLKTKEFPDLRSFSVSLSAGGNTNTHFQNQLTYKGGSTDFLTFDDGTRHVLPQLPSFISDGKPYAEKFTDIWTAHNTFHALPNLGFSASYADKFDLDIPIGLIAGLNYSARSSYVFSEVFYPSANINPNYDTKEKRMTREYNLGALFNISFGVSETDKLSLKTSYTRNAEDNALSARGIALRIDGDSLQSSKLTYVERGILTTQITGDHVFFRKHQLKWSGQFAYASRIEPDNRQTYYVKRGSPDFVYDVTTTSRNSRFFSSNDDLMTEERVDWKYPIKIWNELDMTIKAGGLFSYRTRVFSARRFNYQLEDDSKGSLKPNELLTSDNVGTGVVKIVDATQPTDGYSAQEIANAVYAMVILPIIYKLRFIGGVRLERNFLDVISKGNNIRGGLDNWNILPSINLIYSPNEDMNFRLALTRTVALPQFRELAPFRFDDYRTGTFGNPYLKQTFIYNVDLRWEWFFGISQVFAITGFFKSFESPLEKVSFASSGSGVNFTTINARSAYSVGIELDLRKNFSFLSSDLEDLSLSINTTFIYSKIFLPDSAPYYVAGVQAVLSPQNFPEQDRPMQGQSPYMINASLSYNNADLGISSSLSYNIIGERIAQVGIRPGNSAFTVGNIVEQPRHQLDFVFSKSLEHFILKLSARNLLDNRYLFTVRSQGTVYNAETYFKGRTFSISISYTL